jgi:hypothetical protein
MDVAPSLELSVHVRTPSPFLPLVVGAKNQISMNEGVEEELIMRSILESNETTLELGGHVGKRIVVRLMRDEDATCSFKVQSVRLSLRGTRIPGEGVSPTVSPTVYPTVYPTNVLLRKRLYMTVCSITNQGSEQLRCHAMKILNCGMNDNNINEELNWGEFVLTNMLLTCVVQAKHSTTVDTTIALLHTMSNCNVSHDEQEEAEETNNTLPFGARLVNHVLRLLSTIHQTSASPCAITGVFKLVRMFWNFAPKACAQATVRYAVHLSEQNVTMTSQRYGFCGCNSVNFFCWVCNLVAGTDLNCICIRVFFIVRCSLFGVHCSVFIVRCTLFGALALTLVTRLFMQFQFTACLGIAYVFVGRSSLAVGHRYRHFFAK